MVDKALSMRIAEMRNAGLGYKKIAAELGLGRDRVRYICKQMEKNPVDTAVPSNQSFCKYCGKQIKPSHTGRPRRFCSDKCKNNYWKDHRDELKRNPEAVYTCVCAYCGSTFESYGNKRRKYCCHQHYILDYFGKTSSESTCYCEGSE